ncbi:MAG: hypothetical protein HFG53_15565 [Lachnospiraceae bacterium]|jgi:hypothetical protein|nr:hypothetical protein [Lachnospiraceae bacterium]
MFYYVLPEFGNKRLLRAEMLEQLRDYPKNIVKLTLEDVSDGILSGGNLSWDNGGLTVSSGMLCWKGRLYFQEKPCFIPCEPANDMQYLKVRFADERREIDQVKGTGEIVLETKVTDSVFELELCRFFLQEGARLRVRHENFEDFSTKYDTVNLLYTPYAAQGESTMAPAILKQYAKELLELKSENIYDVSFAMNTLAMEGNIPATCIREYLKTRLEMLSLEKLSRTDEYYKNLLLLLHRLRRGDMGMSRQIQERRGIKLI